MDWIVSFREKIAGILRIVELPFQLFVDAIRWEAPPIAYLLYDGLIVLIAVLLLKKWGGSIIGFFQRDRMATKSDVDALVAERSKADGSMHNAHSLKGAVDPLKKNKQWDKLGELYASVGMHAEAAKAFKKAGDLKSAAGSVAKSGKPMVAAKLLLKVGEGAEAGCMYMEAGKFVKAAQAFERVNDQAAAANAYGKAKQYDKAVSNYADYFASPRDNEERQTVAAKQCYELMSNEAAKKKISEEDRKRVLPGVAAACEREKNYELAAQLYKESGDLARAGEVFVLAGRLQEAAESFKAAGKPKEAALSGGRFYELNKRWREAAMAYAGGESWLKSAECFAKAEEPVRAAEFYAKGGANAQAGVMFAKAGRFEDAISALQKVSESDKAFNASRALLGRCFYEMHDYAHCAATLENHLLGKRIEQDNKDYFYMMALAYEQMGKLQESRDVLYKLGAVDRAFRDVNQRLSSIDTRISLMDSKLATDTPVTNGSSGQGSSEVLGLVQNTLGERYSIEKELGRGGMGVVYLAKDKQLDRQVALKFLGSLVDGSDEYRERFVREARAAAKINHPNVVAIYDISASEGKAYIAMEFIEGPSLLKFIQNKKKLELREAANIIGQALSALQALHESGIVHRDIKPENIILTQGGLVKLMDFGLAKSNDHRITKANMVMGTPCYMAPEQAMGKEVDGRADLYAMGLLLYEMLTGDVLFKDGDIIMRQIKEVPPKLSSLAEGVPDAIDEFADKSVAKNPDDRFQSAKEMADMLRILMKAGS